MSPQVILLSALAFGPRLRLNMRMRERIFVVRAAHVEVGAGDYGQDKGAFHFLRSMRNSGGSIMSLLGGLGFAACLSVQLAMSRPMQMPTQISATAARASSLIMACSFLRQAVVKLVYPGVAACCAGDFLFVRGGVVLNVLNRL